jgi:hypothetical protein
MTCLPLSLAPVCRLAAALIGNSGRGTCRRPFHAPRLGKGCTSQPGWSWAPLRCAIGRWLAPAGRRGCRAGPASPHLWLLIRPIVLLSPSGSGGQSFGLPSARSRSVCLGLGVSSGQALSWCSAGLGSALLPCCFQPGSAQAQANGW